MLHQLSFYKTAADLLKLVKDSGKNVKNILYSEKKYKFMNIKALYALVTEALKHWPVLEVLIEKSEILIKEPKFNIWHVRILVTELLFGKKEVKIEHEFVQTLLKYEKKFRQIMCMDDVQKLMLNLPKHNVIGIKVRYIKVNTIISDVESVINAFNNEGWEQLPQSDCYQDYLNQLRNLEPGSQLFVQDFHISEVLAFPPGTELHEHELYTNGSFYFMDKSSCLAPYLLQPQPHATVLDMCAAPGLKAIHLAGLVSSGKVYAVERDANRYKTLQEMIGCSGATNVVTIPGDVTRLELDKFKDVEYILLDPSCSGSGMRDRQPRDNHEGGDNTDRLYRLQSFQLTLLRFALTRFPAAKRVVYSTCSVNVEENEEVVHLALTSKYHNFDVVPIDKKLPGWASFGSSHFSFGSKCVYSLPESDFTNGFFVAVFERKKSYSKDKTGSLTEVEHAIDQVPVLKRRKRYSKDDTESFTKSEYEINQDSVLTKKNRYSKDETESLTKGRYVNDDESVLHRKNSYTKDETESLIEGGYKTNKNSQNDPTKLKKHSIVQQNNETPSNNSLNKMKLSKKRSLSEINLHSDNNGLSNHKKMKKDKSSVAVPIQDSNITQPKEAIGTQQVGKNVSKTSSKKPTKSQKKRMRQIKIKSKLSQSTNKEKKKVNALKSSDKKIKQNKGNDKSGKLVKNIKTNEENKNKLSKSKLRHLRLKRLKFGTKLVSNGSDELGNYIKKQIKKLNQTNLNVEENLTTDKTLTGNVSPTNNTQDFTTEPKPLKKKHKKNKLDRTFNNSSSCETTESSRLTPLEDTEKILNENKLHKKKTKRKKSDEAELDESFNNRHHQINLSLSDNISKKNTSKKKKQKRKLNDGNSNEIATEDKKKKIKNKHITDGLDVPTETNIILGDGIFINGTHEENFLQKSKSEKDHLEDVSLELSGSNKKKKKKAEKVDTVSGSNKKKKKKAEKVDTVV